MKETAAAIQPGTAALFVLVRKVTADKVLEGLKGEGGTVLKTSLDHTKEAALQAALAGVQAAVPASLQLDQLQGRLGLAPPGHRISSLLVDMLDGPVAEPCTGRAQTDQRRRAVGQPKRTKLRNAAKDRRG